MIGGTGNNRGLNVGSEGQVYMCLKKDSCYSAKLIGGTIFEVSWKIQEVELGTGNNVRTVAQGLGAGLKACEFSLGDADSCITTCDGMCYE